MNNKNLILNGDFETGDFTHWTVQVLDGKAAVVHHDRNPLAQIQPGPDNGVLLFNRFGIKPGGFTVSLDAFAPQAKYHEEPPQIETHPILFFFISSYASDGQLIQWDIGSWWLTRTQKSFRYLGNMPSDAVSAEVRISFPSDPLQVKGPLNVDNVSYILSPTEPRTAKRWSR